jgi:hypothetical protein
MLVSVRQQDIQLFSKLGKFVAWLIVFEMGMTLAEVIILYTGGTESIAAARSLFSGQIGFLFLGVEIVLGSVIPVVILMRNKASVFTQALASLLILIGIFAMRYVIVIGGQLIS